MGLLGVVAVAFAVLLAGGTWYRIRDDRRMMAAWPSRGAYAWESGWDVRRYHRALLTWLKVEDWRIVSAIALDDDRLLLTICRERYRLPTLLLRPGITLTEADRETLRAAQFQDGATRALLVSDRSTDPMPVQAEDGSAILYLNYEALPFLNQDIDAAFGQVSMPVPPEKPPTARVAADSTETAADSVPGTVA